MKPGGLQREGSNPLWLKIYARLQGKEADQADLVSATNQTCNLLRPSATVPHNARGQTNEMKMNVVKGNA